MELLQKKVIALSSCEAEYISSTLAVYQGIWIRRFIHELIGSYFKHFDLCVDNKSAIEISQNPVYHGRTKHIEVRYQFIRICVEEDKVKLKYIWTKINLSICSQNRLESQNLLNFRRKLVSSK